MRVQRVERLVVRPAPLGETQELHALDDHLLDPGPRPELTVRIAASGLVARRA